MSDVMRMVPKDGAQDLMLNRQEYVDNLITTTFYDTRKQLYSDIFKVTPLFDLMMEGGRIKERVPDGTKFAIPIGYGKLSQNQKWFGRGDTFGEKEAEFMTQLEFQVKNFGDSIVQFWDDSTKNRGKAQILNYVEQVIMNHKASYAESLSDAIWGSETGNPLALTSLPELVSTTPSTGTIGGLDRSKNPYLVNQTKDFTGLTVDANLLDEMETMMNNCSKYKTMGKASPDIIITTQTIYERYQKLARALGVFEFNTSSRAVNMRMGKAMFGSAEMFWDPECPAGTMYFLNTDTLEMPYDPMYYMQMTAWKEKYNSLDRYAQVVTRTNLCCNSFLKNGVMFNISTAA